MDQIIKTAHDTRRRAQGKKAAGDGLEGHRD